MEWKLCIKGSLHLDLLHNSPKCLKLTVVVAVRHLGSTGTHVMEQNLDNRSTYIKGSTGTPVAKEKNSFQVDLRIQGVRQDAVLEDEERMSIMPDIVIQVATWIPNESIIKDLGKEGNIQHVQRSIKTHNQRIVKYWKLSAWNFDFVKSRREKLFWKHKERKRKSTLLNWWTSVIPRMRSWNQSTRSIKDESCFEMTLWKTTRMRMQYLLNKDRLLDKWQLQKWWTSLRDYLIMQDKSPTQYLLTPR